MAEGNAAADLRRWSAKADAGWLGGIEVTATDLAESLPAGLVSVRMQVWPALAIGTQ